MKYGKDICIKTTYTTNICNQNIQQIRYKVMKTFNTLLRIIIKSFLKNIEVLYNTDFSSEAIKALNSLREGHA